MVHSLGFNSIHSLYFLNASSYLPFFTNSFPLFLRVLNLSSAFSPISQKDRKDSITASFLAQRRNSCTTSVALRKQVCGIHGADVSFSPREISLHKAMFSTGQSIQLIVLTVDATEHANSFLLSAKIKNGNWRSYWMGYRKYFITFKGFSVQNEGFPIFTSDLSSLDSARNPQKVPWLLEWLQGNRGLQATAEDGKLKCLLVLEIILQRPHGNSSW